MKFTCAVLIVSDGCFNKTSTDECGLALVEEIKKSFPEAVYPNSCIIVADTPDEIFATLETLCKNDINLILTAGGTVLQANEIAMLSRAVVGVKDNSLMINLPKKLKDALVCFGFIKSIIPQTIELIGKHKKSIKRKLPDDQQDSEEENIAIKKKSDKQNYEPSHFKLTTPPQIFKNYSFPLKSFDDALKIVCDSSKYLFDIEEIGIEDSLNRVLAPDDNLNKTFQISSLISRRDGYGVISADGEGERILKRNVCAPDHNQSNCILKSGEAVRISFGGCLPKPADAVIPKEDAWVNDSNNKIKIMIKEALTGYEHFTSKENVKFESRKHITSAHIGIFASLDIFKVKVYKSARVGIFATGDALYSQTIVDFSSGQSRNSNNLMLLNLLKTFGYAANDLGIVKLDPDLLKEALCKAFTQHDIIITTGGVSIGEYEMMKKVLKIDFGATIHFGRVKMAPGYLTSFATCSFNGSSKYIFSLPGDCDSAMIYCRLLVIPALRTYEHSSNKTYNPFSVYYDNHQERKIIKGFECRKFLRITLSFKDNEDKQLYFDDINNNVCNSFNQSFKTDELAAILIIAEGNEIILERKTKFDAIMLYN